VIGKYTTPTESSAGKFVAAVASEALDKRYNAIKLRFHLDKSTDVRVIAPLISLFGRNLTLNFSSGAVAYRTESGTIALAMDPFL
jgi:hypothetical protein